MQYSQQFIKSEVMELKEIEEQIRYCIDNGMASPVSDIIKNIQAFGKEQYNQALLDAAENADVEYMFGDEWQVDQQSILNLKKH